MIVNIDDLRRQARRRLPRAVFDYIDGGAEDEYTLRANRLGFQHTVFRPRVLVDAGSRDLSTTVLGQTISMPVILAPTGLTGLFWPQGEQAAARAAAKKGTVFTLSTLSIAPLEAVAQAAPGPLWFQLYVFRDRELIRELVQRATAAGFKALCLTVDVQVAGQRERDIRNGFTIPPRVTVGNVVDSLQRVGYLRGLMKDPRPTFGNFVGTAGAKGDNAVALATFVNQQFDPTLSWKDLDWFRSIWSGPLAIKGIMSAEDARLAVDHGADAVIVSNHGGRQLDGLPGSIEVLPEVLEAVGDRTEVILDGGVRRGADVMKAVAMGARACMVGRAFLYGLAAGGQPGVERALTILEDEIDRGLTLIGCPSISALDQTFIRTRASF